MVAAEVAAEAKAEWREAAATPLPATSSPTAACYRNTASLTYLRMTHVSRSGSSKTCGWGAIGNRWRWICHGHDADAVKDESVLLLWCFVVGMCGLRLETAQDGVGTLSYEWGLEPHLGRC
jgi:hypothetical protein